MRRVINAYVEGLETTDVDNMNKDNTNLLVIVADESIDEDISRIYKKTKELIKGLNTRIILIGVGKSRLFETLMTLMLQYDRYDIYSVDTKDIITGKYIEALEDREPDISEVELFAYGDNIVSSEISDIAYEIEECVKNGDIDGLKKVIEDNTLILENLSDTMNKMKRICKMIDTEEFVSQMNELKEDNKKLKEDIDKKDNTIKEIEQRIANDSDEISKLKSKCNELETNNSDSSKNNAYTSNVISEYKTVQTQLVKGNRVKIILYFKEITYVRYTNTLVMMLFKYLKLRGLKIKLLIYDNEASMSARYSDLRVVNCSDYTRDKELILEKAEKLVIVEPGQMIIEDMLTLNGDESTDVLIVYDRMHKMNDIVEGNMVTKYFVLNSSNDYNKLKKQMKINDTDCVITSIDSSINMDNDWKIVGDRDFLDIPSITDYKRYAVASESYEYTKYSKLNSKISNKPIINTILTRSKINTLL